MYVCVCVCMYVCVRSAYLDEFFPLAGATYEQVTGFSVKDGHLLANGSLLLSNPEQFVGYSGNISAPSR